MTTPRIQVSTVGSYPVPDWLAAYPNEQTLVDATRVIFATQRDAGVDLPTDGELYRFDVDHPDTNGMIEYFTGKFDGVDSRVSRSDLESFRAKSFFVSPSTARMVTTRQWWASGISGWIFWRT